MASQAYDKALQIDSSNTSAQTKLAMIRDMMTSSRPTTARATGKPGTVVAAAAQPTARAEPAAAVAAKPAPTVEVAVSGDAAEINKTVAAWAAAWSRKDVKTYLAFYASDFETPGGISRADWEAERNKRIDKPGAIEVTVENLKITANGPDSATVKFHQNYKAAALRSSASKTLLLVKHDGKWLIKLEQAAK